MGEIERMNPFFVLSCEHAGNLIPEQFLPLFSEHQDVLNTHRGIDIGANYLFEQLSASQVWDHAQKMEISRLLIEMNRSLHHPRLFSEFSNSLPPSTKKELINHYYLPYRLQLENIVRQAQENQLFVFHLSVHSFTPVWEGESRKGDICWLYDPGRPTEKRLADRLTTLGKKETAYLFRRNYPYLGKADGFTTYLRKRFAVNYAGIELEVNQRFFTDGSEAPEAISAWLKQLFYALKESWKEVMI